MEMKRQMEINKEAEETRYLHRRRRVFFNLWKFCCAHRLAARGISMNIQISVRPSAFEYLYELGGFC